MVVLGCTKGYAFVVHIASIILLNLHGRADGVVVLVVDEAHRAKYRCQENANNGEPSP